MRLFLSRIGLASIVGYANIRAVAVKVRTELNMENKDAIISFLETEQIFDEAALKSLIELQRSTGQSLIGILKQKKVLNETQMTQVVAAGGGIEFVNLAPETIDPMVANLISYEIANRYNVIPVRKENNKLFLAMSSPLNLTARDNVEVKTGYKVVPLAATLSAVKQAIQYHFSVQNVTKQAIISMRLEQDAKGEEGTDAEQKSAKVTDAPITKLVRSIVTGAIDSRASDVHIEPQSSDVKVRYRIDGILRPALDIPLSAMAEVISHIKIISDMDISERRMPQDGHMIVSHNDREYDLRVSSLPGVTGEKMVMRILDRDVNRWSLDTVVSSPEDKKKFIELASNPNGMILLTGPTGCGKTTTLYSILQMLNKPEDNIVTVEDPVEYRLDGITQVQVRPAAGMTFASALRSIVRQDPDIILVGEIRDYETAEMAISAALTGHLVLSTLHTKDAAGAISRLVNLGIQPFLIASALLGTVAQRLVRTLCADCAQQYEAAEEELKMIFHETQKRGDAKLRKASGCAKCYQEGYRGRRSIYEILMVTENIKKMISEKSSTEAIEAAGNKRRYEDAASQGSGGSTEGGNIAGRAWARGGCKGRTIMKVYEYTAKNKFGHKLSGTYENVDDVETLRDELGKIGYRLVKARREEREGKRKLRVNSAEVVSFAYKFSEMYSAGLSIIRCLETLEQQTQDRTFKYIISDIRQNVQTGSSLSRPFEKYRDIFSDFFIGMIAAGETGGQLAKSLEMSAIYLEKQREVRRKVKSAFAYPIAVCVTCLAVIAGLMIFVIPVFSKMYNQLHVKLPLPTQVLVIASVLVRHWWWALLIVGVATAEGCRRLFKSRFSGTNGIFLN